jgi:hypothetical protein
MKIKNLRISFSVKGEPTDTEMDLSIDTGEIRDFGIVEIDQLIDVARRTAFKQKHGYFPPANQGTITK